MSYNKLNIMKSYRDNSWRVNDDFRVRMSRITRMIKGRLGHPVSNYYDPTEGAKEPQRTNKSKNHLGVYDFVTLGIPYLIESFCRGNMFDRKKVRTAWQIAGLFLGWTYVAAALATVRFTVGIVSAVVTFIPVGIYHQGRKMFDKTEHQSGSKPAGVNDMSEQKESTMSKKNATTYAFAQAAFDKSFENVQRDMSAEFVSEYWRDKTLGHRDKALDAAEVMCKLTTAHRVGFYDQLNMLRKDSSSSVEPIYSAHEIDLIWAKTLTR